MDSVNRETDELLRQSAHTREELSAQTYEDIIHAAVTGAGDPRPSASHRDPTDSRLLQPVYSPAPSVDSIRREVRAALATEMQAHQQLVREMVAREWDSRMGDVDSLLKSRFRELRAASDGMGRGVLEVSEQLGSVEATLSARLAVVEADLSRRVGENRREVAELSRALQSQVEVLRSSIVDSKIDADSQERRAEEIRVRGEEVLRRHVDTLEAKRRELERSVEEMLRVDRQQQRDEIDRIRRHANGYEERIIGLEHSFHRMQRVVEDAAVDTTTVKSQLRVTRGDVNQLELLVRGLSSQRPPVAAAVAPALNDRVMDDIFALKQSVAYLAESMERQARHIPTPQSDRYEVPVDSEEEGNSRLARSALD